MSAIIPAPAPKKRQRIAKACDFCHGRGIKCAASEVPNKCKSCSDFAVPCTYDRPSKRRGPSRSSNLPLAQPAASSSSPVSDGPWIAPHVANIVTIQALADIYAQVVYPIFPLFHFPTLKAKIQLQVYRTDRAFFTCLMVVCALAAARVRDGAVTNLSPTISALLADARSEVFHAAAEAAFPSKLVEAQEFEYLRASGLLAILAIQNGQPEFMHQHLGNYMTLVALQGVHDEARWPSGISGVERQERRRLYWSMYTLEVFTSIIWGGVIRCREAQSAVRYPANLDDEFIVDDPDDLPGVLQQQPDGQICFLIGWNFTTDLYRILEHAVDRFRRRRAGGTTNSLGNMLDQTATSSAPETILDLVGVMYSNLPARFKETRQVGDPVEDRFDFQTANIIATMQLLRMVVLGGELEEASGEKRCQVAGELLDAFSTIPTTYLRAISSPLLFHLAGIGHILGSVIEGLSPSSFRKIRHILLRMADLLASLEAGLRSDVSASTRLRSLVERIDQFIIANKSTSAMRRESPNRILPIESFDGAFPKTESPQSPLVSVDLGNQTFQSSLPLAPLGTTDLHLPFEMLQDWPWPFDPTDNSGLFPDILGGWSH